MATVEIYTADYCPYCHRAKRLLDKKNVAYREYDVTVDQEGRRAMSERAGGRQTVPQIFINGQHVGGCDDLHALNDAGKLDALLQQPDQ